MQLMYVFLFISLYFEVFLLVSFIQVIGNRIVRKHQIHEGVPLPSVAIIVPCFNEEKTLAHTVESLLSLEYPKDKLSILVVDDGSRDNTLEVARTFEQFPQVRVFHKENGGKHTAMNFALERTDAEFIGCLDADSIVEPDALLAIAPIFENRMVAAVTPGILIKRPKTILQYMQDAEYRLSVFNRFTLAALGSAFITPGPFSIFRSSVIREVGGWKHGHSTEDLEMALSIQERGYLIANAPEAVVYTGTPRTVPALFRQRVRWTYGFLRNAIDYRHMFANSSYGNLGIIILPTALLSIGIAIFFFLRVVFYGIQLVVHSITRIAILGLQLPHSFDVFYFNTSMVWFLIYTSVLLVVVLISIGSFIGTGSRKPPLGTPLFVLLYSFLVPLWLGTAVVRALFKTGVRWR